MNMKTVFEMKVYVDLFSKFYCSLCWLLEIGIVYLFFRSKRGKRSTKKAKVASQSRIAESESDYELEMEAELEQPQAPIRSSSDPRFLSDITAAKYTKLRGNNFILEKRVELNPDDYSAFMKVIDERRWGKIAKPKESYNADVVKQFFANAYYSEEAQQERWTWVAGVKVPYDKHAINAYLGKPWEPHGGGDAHNLCDHQLLVKKGKETFTGGYSDREVRKALVVDHLDVEQLSGPIHRFCMTELAQIWTTFILCNIWPASHVSTLPMAKARLLFSILNDNDVDISTIISDAIAECIERDASPMILPSIITDFCRYRKVPIPSRDEDALRGCIDAGYVRNNCQAKSLDWIRKKLKEKEKDKRRQQQESPPVSEHQPSQMEILVSQMQQLQSQMAVMQEQRAEDRALLQQADTRFAQIQAALGIQDQQQRANFQATIALSGHARGAYFSRDRPYDWPTNEEFAAQIPWPEGRPHFTQGEGGSSHHGGDGDDDLMGD